MREIRDPGWTECLALQAPLPGGADPAAAMRATLHDFLGAAARGTLPLHLPQRLGEPAPRGEGHFHLAPELFLQQSGWTEFRFPHMSLRLQAGEALLVPPQLRHAERVGGHDGEPFRNLVVFADGTVLSCHLALARGDGRPGIAHLEACAPTLGDAQVTRVHDWLCDASRAGAEPRDRAFTQARALVAAALAGVLHALHPDRAHVAAPEPALVARVRMLVQNQLGDPALGVQRLAEQAACSADHLSHVWRRHTGEGLAACITRLRMQRAAGLLRETSLSVKEVAWACGFAAPSYFIRVFRQTHGLTPQAWREAPPARPA